MLKEHVIGVDFSGSYTAMKLSMKNNLQISLMISYPNNF